jgi:hypothetical protein
MASGTARRSRHMRPLLIRNPNLGLPACSWWTTCATREDFRRAAAAERVQMSVLEIRAAVGERLKPRERQTEGEAGSRRDAVGRRPYGRVIRFWTALCGQRWSKDGGTSFRTRRKKGENA